MRTDLFHYELPPHLIAQEPGPRGGSRMLVLNRQTGQTEHRLFADLPNYIRENDLLVLNDTRVSARRVPALRENGREAEALLLRPVGETGWEALVRPGLREGRSLVLLGPNEERLEAKVTAETAEGGRLLEFETQAERDRVGQWGETPLPPYIHRSLTGPEEERYQTVYGCRPGSAAAPTAGLHFTQEMLAALQEKGVQTARVTLHVGVDTFRPVRSSEAEGHEMHGEWIHVPNETAEAVNSTKGRVVAIGTTSARALETAAAEAKRTGAPGRTVPFTGETKLFITPGYAFGAVEALLTNFHLPCSTLLMLISALAGREKVMSAYREAVEREYRFYSFGDAMFIE